MIEVLYRDENFIFVNKPSGLLIHRTRESEDQIFLLQMLREQIQEYVYPVHRLDRAVSGIVGFALNPVAAAELQLQMSEKSEKVYLGLVRGRAPSSGVITKALHDDKGVLRECYTEYSTLDACDYCSLLEIKIKTGRRHQIRRHMSSIAHQIIGDTNYGKGRLNQFYREKYKLGRIFLHAWKVRFEDHEITAQLPSELVYALDQMTAEGLLSSCRLA